MIILQTQCNALLKPLQMVVGMVERRHTLPILSNVLMEQTHNALHITATDLDIQISTRGPAFASEDFSLTTSAKKLLDILRAIPEQATLSLDQQAERLVLTSGKSRFNLQTLPAKDFPKLEMEPEILATFTLSQQHLHQLLSLVQYSVASQDIRYYLNGLLLQTRAQQCHFVATDGHRLAYVQTVLDDTMPDLELIVPKKTVTELYKLISLDADKMITVKLSAKQAVFEFDAIQIISKMIDGKFPNYNDAIPLDNDKIFLANRLDLLHALQRAAILANEKERHVQLSLKPNALSIVCTNSENEEAEEELEIAYQGEAMTIHFNVNYLLDLLNNLSDDTLQLALSDNRHPALFVVPGNPNFKYVVMPLRV